LLIGVADPLVGRRSLIARSTQAVDQTELSRVPRPGIGTDIGEYSAQPGMEVVFATEPVQSQIRSEQGFLYGIFGIAGRAQPPPGLGSERAVMGPDDLGEGVGIACLESRDQAPVVVRVKRL
jgi:hypothetical protein